MESLKDFFPSPISLNNYLEVFKQIPMMGSFFWSSLLVCFWGVVLELLFCSLAAYPLARMKFFGKNFIMVLLLSTLLLPVQAAMVINFITIRQLHLFDTYTAVILPGAVSAFGIFLMRQAFLVIPQELLDAARIDGTNELQLWWKILLPLTRPHLAALTIFTFVAYWNTFMWPLIVLKHEAKYPVTVGLSYLANMFASDFRIVAAASILSSLPVLILFLFTQKYFIKGMEGIGKI